MKYIYINIIIVFITFDLCGQNLIQNGSFEYGNYQSCRQYTSEMNNWKTDCENCDNCTDTFFIHSPDWYNTQVIGPITSPTPSNGAKLIGMDIYELIQQPVNPDYHYHEGDFLYLQLDFFKKQWHPAIMYKLNKFTGVKLNVYFAKRDISYKSDNIHNSDYTQHSTILQDIKLVHSFDLSDNSIPFDEWHKLTCSFRAPSLNYNWIAFEIVNSDGVIDDYSYNFIDNIGLTNLCSHPCMERFQPVEMISNPISNVCLVNYNPGVWNFKVKNAQTIDFYISDRWGGIQHFSDFDVNGLVDNGHDYYQFVWNGYDGSYLPYPDGVYTYRLIITNCNSYYETDGSITVVSNSNPPFVFPSYNQYVFNNEGCCPLDKYLANETQNSKIFQVSNSIITGGQYYIIPSGQSVTFDAGNYIKLQSGFKAVNGSEFVAKIQGCSSSSSKNQVTQEKPKKINLEDNVFSEFLTQNNDSVIRSNNLELIEEVTLLPNPTTGKIIIRPNNAFVTKIGVYSIIGNFIENFESNSSEPSIIDISHLPSGMYQFRIYLKNSCIMKKIIKK
jgi:hypothetical protein